MGTFLDIPTLLVTTAVACFCVCVSLFLIWRSARNEIFVFDWSLSYGLVTVTMLLVAVRGRLPTVLAMTAPGALLLACFGVLWLGYRQFSDRTGRFDRFWAVAGVLAWLTFSLTGSPFTDSNLRGLVNSSIELTYLLSIVHDLVHHQRKAPLPAAKLTIALFIIHAVKLLIVNVFYLSGVLDTHAVVMPNTVFFGLSFIESALFTVFLGLLQLVLIGQRSERRLRVAAETDSLTGLANRRHFLDSIHPHLLRAGGRGALIIFDIDHFKHVNDTFGHPAGDWALAEFAAILSTQAPAGSIAARVGGEEFALFLPDWATAEAAEVAERIRRTIADLRIPAPAGELRLTVSGGVAGVGESGSDYQALHCAADSALYTAKSAGRDRVAVFGQRAAVPRGAAA